VFEGKCLIIEDFRVQLVAYPTRAGRGQLDQWALQGAAGATRSSSVCRYWCRNIAVGPCECVQRGLMFVINWYLNIYEHLITFSL